MRKYRKRLIREKAVIATYQKLLVDTSEEEIKEYLNSDKELCADRSDYDYCLLMITSIVNKIGKYQDEVAKHLKKNWSVDRLSKIELAILIVACYELLETDQSREIIINEAVELSKKYCDNDSYKFINGLLNKVVK
ncbi:MULTISPECIES: transcription antitermination factor NusB [unclassified Thomasclavelia]|uniref:Transcription antitermination factor NusB n=1 Tax=Candidatus Erysipelatoclostridium merdavium TaxID=2838566 RepID=A0A9D1XJN4_9FIRM|nr:MULTISPECIES: transcription antitermination factor NusB [unclassified Thomasclavelia]OUP79043.1 transcription antitermination factor NusB [Erysipelatoclostridium sp. An173]OUQ09334.1 transcription antitermination factor NusB [Erysipelatoclostridium sp. An15]WRK54901.1 transcription antitermination factor NusB [Coprobacillaceae bacterium CR2/5/TPMF4]HIX80657.1 transcription antitermination factor NusB [Candidatus Erysipelatoclostridium merdavium]